MARNKRPRVKKELIFLIISIFFLIFLIGFSIIKRTVNMRGDAANIKRICKPVCMGIGTRSEGWYNSCTRKLIKYERCGLITPTLAKSTPTPAVSCKPICDAVGTKSEGWYNSCTKKLINYDQCRGCTAECKTVTLSSEGWWYSSCGQKLIRERCSQTAPTGINIKKIP